FSLFMIFPYFVRNMRYLKKEWDVIGLEKMRRRNDFARVQDAVVAWIIGMLVLLIVLGFLWIRGWSIWQKKKISAVINNQLADFVIIEQLDFATETKSQRKLNTISEISIKPTSRTNTTLNNSIQNQSSNSSSINIDGSGIWSGGCTDEKRVTLKVGQLLQMLPSEQKPTKYQQKLTANEWFNTCQTNGLSNSKKIPLILPTSPTWSDSEIALGHVTTKTRNLRLVDEMELQELEIADIACGVNHSTDGRTAMSIYMRGAQLLDPNEYTSKTILIPFFENIITARGKHALLKCVLENGAKKIASNKAPARRKISNL
ncbi:4269_t:CDS:2, partial [Ambispora gerdemannii]